MKFKIGDIVKCSFQHSDTLYKYKEGIGRIVDYGVIDKTFRVYFFNQEIRNERYNKDIEWMIDEDDIKLYKPVLKKFIEEMEKKSN